MSPAGNENPVDNDNNYNANEISFTIKVTKLHVLVITSSAKDNQKLSKLLSKWYEQSVYWNEHKTKSEIKNIGNEYRIKFC